MQFVRAQTNVRALIIHTRSTRFGHARCKNTLDSQREPQLPPNVSHRRIAPAAPNPGPGARAAEHGARAAKGDVRHRRRGERVLRLPPRGELQWKGPLGARHPRICVQAVPRAGLPSRVRGRASAPSQRACESARAAPRVTSSPIRARPQNAGGSTRATFRGWSSYTARASGASRSPRIATRSGCGSTLAAAAAAAWATAECWLIAVYVRTAVCMLCAQAGFSFLPLIKHRGVVILITLLCLMMSTHTAVKRELCQTPAGGSGLSCAHIISYLRDDEADDR